MFIISCSSDDSGNNGNNTNPNLVTSIGGTVNNLPSDSKLLRSEVIKDTNVFVSGSTTAGNDNSFNINLTAPPNEYLVSIFDLFPFPISDLNADASSSIAMGAYLVNTSYNQNTGNISGHINKSNREFSISNAVVGDFAVLYLYSNSTENFNGTSTRILNSDTIKYNANISLGTGYNKITSKIIAKRTGFTEISFTSGEESGGSWYFLGVSR